MTITLSEDTKSRISTLNAPLPKPNIDGNIGKVASVSVGPYAGLKGIIYSRHEGIGYVGEYGKLITGNYKRKVPYLLMFFYDTGKFFCAIETKLTDMKVVGGAVTPPRGEGTSASPFTCGIKVEAGNGSGTFYHKLPDYAGIVRISYDMYNLIADTLDVFYINDLHNSIASTGGPVLSRGILSFYYDPAFNSNKIMIRVISEIGPTATAWEYTIDCPV